MSSDAVPVSCTGGFISGRGTGIDPPSPRESAFVAVSGREIVTFGKFPNDDMLGYLDFHKINCDALTVLVIEMVGTYGMPVGSEVFETCLWIGRFIERWRGKYEKILRATVRANLCHSNKATDSNVRAALIERYGGQTAAIGNVKAKGPLHGVTGDVWSALAVLETYRDRADEGSGKGFLR